MGGRARAGRSLATVVLSIPSTPNLLMTAASFAGVPIGVAHAVPAHTNASGTPYESLDANIARAAAGIALARSASIRITTFPGRYLANAVCHRAAAWASVFGPTTATIASPFARYSSASPTVATELLSIDPAIDGASAI